ncbi:hypothetical protein ENBRE01_1140 [Enteropsectra breve]|nr:hypothetical protein ENBRE01_1140 [Enteropsectra breve]
MFHNIFVNKHDADARRFSYPIYRWVLTEQLISTDFNETTGEEILISLPAFIYDAILKVLFTMAPTHFDEIFEKVTEFATIYKCNTNYADFLRETYKAQECGDIVVSTSIVECLEQDDYQTATFLFKNLPDSSYTQAAIELFKSTNKLPNLIEEIKTYEFVNWENETPIYNMLQEHEPLSVETVLRRMSVQASCFFAVPSERVDQVIEGFHKHCNNYSRSGSLAFVCRNKELLESFNSDLDSILSKWGFFALDLKNFFKGVNSPEGVTSITDLPFFKMYFAEIFLWLDNNIADEDVALKISSMLMVAKLALRDLTVRMEVGDVENPDSELTTGQENKLTKGSSVNQLEKCILNAVSSTKVGYQALCAFQFYMSSAFKKYLEEEVLPDIVDIEGACSDDLLKAREFRVLYRKLLKMLEELNTEQGMDSCSEEEMRKFLEMLSVLKKLETEGALNAIKKKSEIEGEVTEIKYFTENIPVVPMRIYNMICRSLNTCGQVKRRGEKRPLEQDA